MIIRSIGRFISRSGNRNASTASEAAQPPNAQPSAIPVSPAQPLQPVPPRRPNTDRAATISPEEQKKFLEAVERTKKLKQPGRFGDGGLYFTAIALLLITPPGVYYWWQHRAEHMAKKKEDMIRNLEIRRKAFRESQKG